VRLGAVPRRSFFIEKAVFMGSEINLYEILGISKSATENEIKRAYRRRSMECHPDKNGGEETEDFRSVNLAYTILMNKQKRLTYDLTGEFDGQTKVDNSRVEAMKELQRVMLCLLEDSDDSIFFENLPARVLELFNLNIQKSKNVMVDLKKSMRRVRRFKKRFHYKKEDNNDFITLGMERKLYEISTSISGEVEKIRMFNLMLELLAGYEYEPEVIAPTFGLRTTSTTLAPQVGIIGGA
jgi:curved DNA-binding protein CbpA